MLLRLVRVMTVLITLLVLGCAAKGDTPAEQRAHIQQMRKQVLADLYRQEPKAKSEINSSAGYAVFSNVNNNLLVLSTGSGFGVVRDRRSGKDTYMNMASVGVGLGVGIKDFRAVLIFKDRALLEQFVEKGWDVGAQADATATSGDKGVTAASEAAAANFDKVKMYQLTDAGVALQATIQGYKYWKDDDLN